MNLCSCFTGRKSLEDCVYDCNSYQLCRIWKSPGRAAQVFYSLILTNHDTNHVQSSFWTLPTFLNSTQQMCTLAWGEGEKCLILINDFFRGVGGGMVKLHTICVATKSWGTSVVSDLGICWVLFFKLIKLTFHSAHFWLKCESVK